MPIVANASVILAALVAVAFVVLVGVVVVFQTTFADRVYPGVRAMGVGIGWHTLESAREKLEARAVELAARPIVLAQGDDSWTVYGSHLGVRPDVESALAYAYRQGREGNLLYRFVTQFGLMLAPSLYEQALPTHDPAVLSAFMEVLAAAVNRTVSDAWVRIDPDGHVIGADSTTGRELDLAESRALIESALADPRIETVYLVVRETPPRLTAADVNPIRERAERLLSKPLIVQFEERTWELSPRQLAVLATIDAQAGPVLLPESVRRYAEGLAREINQYPENARFSWVDGNVGVVREHRDGRELDINAAVRAIVERAFTDDRVVKLPVVVTKPTVTLGHVERLNIQGLIETSRTAFAGSSPPKQANITLASQRLNGIVVPPGETFSFNRELGSTSLDAGFKMGWGIVNTGKNPKTVPSVAGGICQVATTLFHSVLWSGYQIEERHTHLYWIPGYGSRGLEGVDATVDEEIDLDFRFTNNTEHYLLIQSWIEGGRVVFGLYGTKPDWTVKIVPGERKDVIDAVKDNIFEDEPSLPAGFRLPVEGAMDGFKITNVRTVTRGGDVRTLNLSSNYKPSRNITYVGTGGRPAGPPRVTPVPTSRPAESRATPQATPRPGAAPQPTPRSLFQPGNLAPKPGLR
jgi:vancomycin resistance protein YoaR